MTDEDRIDDLEDENSYLRDELDRLGDKIADLEMYDHDNLRLHSLIRNLYISKISLSPSLFERELKSFFMESIDKRL